MITSYLVTSNHDPLADLFRQAENGRLSFGLFGESKVSATPEDVLVHEVEIRDYIMEGFITYFVQAKRQHDGYSFQSERPAAIAINTWIGQSNTIC
ncbi:hypothetical protein [Pseudacidovorax intermedius]|uniref:hypothetical protein n=1 Tax=Pseudacidovorax intermedius TaxID=433924 RepID=UPI0012DE3583|nr:hypothetical protein [Pseudacidovorax intermedius]